MACITLHLPTVSGALNFVAALFGLAGTVFLYRGTFGFESPGAYQSQETYGAMIQRNRHRQRLQHIGLALLACSFTLQGVTSFVG
jgi:hypothetical protein